MTETQKVIKYVALALAIALIVAIVGGIVTGLSFLSLVFTDSETVSVSKLSDYSVNDVERLYIDLQAADLELISGDEFSLKSNHEYLKVDESSNSLRIEETKRPWNMHDIGYKVIVTIPENTTLESVTVSTGAGKLVLDDFSTRGLNLTLGAGEVLLNNIKVSEKTEFEGGAGAITITDCCFADLDMQIGVGECNFTAEVSGDSEINCGVGETNLTFVRTPNSDYTITVDKGLGEVTADGEKLKDGDKVGFGENAIDINCGVGKVNIEFVNR